MKYTEQAVEMLDDAGSVIANKNIEIEQLRQRVQELEERRCEIYGYAEHHREHTGCLRTQLAAAQEECEFQRNAHKQAEELMLEQGNQLTAAQEEMNDWRNQAHQSQSSFDRLQDQLAKAEQRVAEACALQVATETKFRWLDAARVANEIRSGEWRKFVKEV